MKYKFIFIVISSSSMSKENEYFNSLDKYNILKKYNSLYYDIFNDQIKYFYVEYKNDLDEELVEQGNMIYVRGSEEPIIPNILNKVRLSIEHVYKNYEFDYILRTNLSSLWNIPVLMSLHDNIPRDNFFGGHVIINLFVTGTGIFISNNLIPLFLELNPLDYSENEDVVISTYMRNRNISFYDLSPLINYKINYQILDESVTDVNLPYHKNNNLEINDDTNVSDILYFRVRNAKIERDIYVFKKVIKRLYNIDL